MYEAVLAAQAAALAAIRPGERMCDVDAAARNRLKKDKLDQAFSHGLGHGIGLDIHEPPRVSFRSEEKLEPGMVITVEPGVYLPGVGGVRIEDDVLVTERGCRILSRVPKSLDEMIV
jgi:Xaa-Pro aminopeptidase